MFIVRNLIVKVEYTLLPGWYQTKQQKHFIDPEAVYVLWVYISNLETGFMMHCIKVKLAQKETFEQCAHDLLQVSLGTISCTELMKGLPKGDCTLVMVI